MTRMRSLIGPLLLAGLPRLAGAQWLESKQPHYSVFYQRGYEGDARLIERWADATERLMKDKYGVTPAHYRMSVYLHPAPTDRADVNNALNRCCTKASDSLSTGTIDMLAPSSPTLQSVIAMSSLGMRKASPDYSAKIFVSEYIPIGHFEVQRLRGDGGWRYYDAPNWFVQGLQEYDAIFHSTPVNRDSTTRRLAAWTVAHPTVFSCCTPALSIKDDYNGGAAFLTFLAVQFGEGIHARLLRSTAATFVDALRAETQPYSSEQLFALFQEWLRHGAPTDPKS
jgi:hypothetical protein